MASADMSWTIRVSSAIRIGEMRGGSLVAGVKRSSVESGWKWVGDEARTVDEEEVTFGQLR